MLITLLVHTFVFALVLLVLITLVFFIAQIRRDNSVMDIAYGPLFFLTAMGTLFFTSGVSATAFLITGLTGLWSIRLALRIYRKNKGKAEDPRYAAWRQEWMRRGRSYFLWRSYLQINLLQGVIILLVSLPFIIATASNELSYNVYVVFFGLAVYAFGLGYEALADYQLDVFLRDKKSGKTTAPLMVTGLFKFSRRPNYFGETLIWWGMAIIVLPLPFGPLAIISPLIITYIVTKVTGPMLENIFLEKYPEQYRAYIATTNYFIPGPKKHST
jgi:steroid 5-alpha reductase family enzyme